MKTTLKYLGLALLAVLLLSAPALAKSTSESIKDAWNAFLIRSDFSEADGMMQNIERNDSENPEVYLNHGLLWLWVGGGVGVPAAENNFNIITQKLQKNWSEKISQACFDNAFQYHARNPQWSNSRGDIGFIWKTMRPSLELAMRYASDNQRQKYVDALEKSALEHFQRGGDDNINYGIAFLDFAANYTANGRARFHEMLYAEGQKAQGEACIPYFLAASKMNEKLHSEEMAKQVMALAMKLPEKEQGRLIREVVKLIPHRKIVLTDNGQEFRIQMNPGDLPIFVVIDKAYDGKTIQWICNGKGKVNVLQTNGRWALDDETPDNGFVAQSRNGMWWVASGPIDWKLKVVLKNNL